MIGSIFGLVLIYFFLPYFGLELLEQQIYWCLSIFIAFSISLGFVKSYIHLNLHQERCPKMIDFCYHFWWVFFGPVTFVCLFFRIIFSSYCMYLDKYN